MNNDLQARVTIAVNNYIPEFIEYYLDDHEQAISDAKKKQIPPQCIIDLILTLKHWANPDANFPLRLSESEQVNFKELKQILENPTQILAQEKHFLTGDDKIIDQMVRAKLNFLADELIQKYKLQTQIEKEMQYSKTSAEDWWNKKSEREKERIRNDYNSLSNAQKLLLQDKLTKEKKTKKIYIYHSSPNPLLLYWMCAWQANLYSQPYNYSSGVLGGYHWGYYSHGTQSSCPTPSTDDCNGSVMAGVGLLALITSGLLAGVYAAKKTYNSFVNICTGNKILRSLYRLTGIGALGFFGSLEGAALGASFGSVLPGIGTVAGAILGGIAGAGLGGGLGALFTKYTAKALSALFYRHEINPTNPEKYRLSASQEKNLVQKGYDLHEIHKMIKAIRREKNKIGIAGSFPGTDEREQKNEWNALLEKVKKGEIEGATKIGLLYYDPLLNRFESGKKNDESLSSTAKFILPGLKESGPQTFTPSAPLAYPDLHPQTEEIPSIDAVGQKASLQATGTGNFRP